MQAGICTLFEGHYHYGLAAFTNSLYQHGYRGSIYAGYKGSLPTWASAAHETLSLPWPRARTLDIAPDLQIHFLPLDTEFHLTNYKPFFMLQLWEEQITEANALAYFDPDIVIKCKWDFFETWMSHGIALVHESDGNNMTATHPIRKEWEKVIIKSNRQTTRSMNSYINGGFCGVLKENIEFIKVWADIIETGIKYFKLTPDQWNHSYTRTYIFCAQDQDALNIAAMCSESPISEIGPEGMDFIQGGFTMSHALGTFKPWKKKFIWSALRGVSPSRADRSYWQSARGPIDIYHPMYIRMKQVSISVAAFISRFYRRN